MGHYIGVKRNCRDGAWCVLEISLFFCHKVAWSIFDNSYHITKVESEAVKEVVTEFVKHFPTLECFTARIEEEFRLMQEYDISDELCAPVILSAEQVSLITHVSCKGEVGGRKKVDGEKPVTRRGTRDNGIPQNNIKYLLKSLDEGSKVLKFFKENECPVCISTYQDIIQNDLHILVLDLCHHPICCSCLDNIRKINKKPECPCCRKMYSTASLMKFGADLKQFGKAFCQSFGN